jgi:hypothetical protein
MSKLSALISMAVFSVFSQISHADPGGVQGRYSEWMDRIISTKSYDLLVKEPSQEPVSVTCLETPGRKFYIGVVQNMRVKAPIQKLQEIVSDFGSYAELFNGYAAVREESRDGDRITTYWEQKIPVFFIPNVRYRMIYQLSVADPNVKIYRYRLSKKGDLLESDGFIVLEKISDAETRYIETDFFDANWGILTTFAPGRIWTDSVDGLYQSDLAFLLKAEHPDWNNRRVHDEADQTIDRMKSKPGERCVAAKLADWSQGFKGLLGPNSSK